MPNNVPFVPQLTGQPLADIVVIHQYLSTLSRYLAEGEPDPGWIVTPILENRVIDPAMTLVELIRAFSALIRILHEKGIVRYDTA